MVIEVEEDDVIVAATPLKLTESGAVKFEPVMVTLVPIIPDAGENDVITGGDNVVTVKLEAVVTLVPFETDIGPVVAFAGTVAVMDVEDDAVMTAATPLKVTESGEIKFVPFMVTLLPISPELGVKELMVGGGTDATVKLVELVTGVPFETDIGPDVALAGTVVVIVVEVKLLTVATTPLNVTESGVLKYVPFMVTVVPASPKAGVNEVIVGGGVAETVKLEELKTDVPFETLMGPVVAFAGTVTVMDVAVDDAIVAGVPLKDTESGVVKFVPVIVTVAPVKPEVGVNELIVGGGVAETVKLFALSTCVPFEMLIGPVVAFAGTVTVTDVAVNDKMVAGVPLKFTESGAVKFVPVIVTVVPANPNAGVKLLMVGG